MKAILLILGSTQAINFVRHPITEPQTWYNGQTLDDDRLFAHEDEGDWVQLRDEEPYFEGQVIEDHRFFKTEEDGDFVQLSDESA